jgi:LemA protein
VTWVIILIIVGVIVIVAIAAVLSYNRFISQRTLIKNAWSNVETELKRRYDLIPNLVETVKGYAAHEREVFEEVARTRSAAAGATGSPAQQAAAEGPLVAALGRLFAVAENYPDLKANQNFLQLQGELANTEDRIQASRRFYNSNVQVYNQRVKSFPSNIIARQFHFQEEEFFEIPETERAAASVAPTVDFGFRGGPAPGGAGPSGGAGPATPPPTPSAPAPPAAAAEAAAPPPPSAAPEPVSAPPVTDPTPPQPPGSGQATA